MKIRQPRVVKASSLIKASRVRKTTLGKVKQPKAYRVVRGKVVKAKPVPGHHAAMSAAGKVHHVATVVHHPAKAVHHPTAVVHHPAAVVHHPAAKPLKTGPHRPAVHHRLTPAQRVRQRARLARGRAIARSHAHHTRRRRP